MTTYYTKLAAGNDILIVDMHDLEMPETTRKAMVRSAKEAGYVQSRPTATVATREWPISWETMDEEEYLELHEFWTSHIGDLCIYYNQVRNIRAVVIIAEENLRARRLRSGDWEVSLVLEEVGAPAQEITTTTSTTTTTTTTTAP
jgi:hypothetical protein